MKPEQQINVLDGHNGFTAITLSKSYEKVFDSNGNFLKWRNVLKERDTLWRPAQLLKGNFIGELQEYNENSFFQNNNDVTKAIYKVKGYRFRIAVWFDNKSGDRIA